MAWEFLTEWGGYNLAHHSDVISNVNEQGVNPSLVTWGDNPLTQAITTTQERYEWQLDTNYTAQLVAGGGYGYGSSSLEQGSNSLNTYRVWASGFGIYINHDTEEAIGVIVFEYQWDNTNPNHWTTWLGIERNTLNRKALYQIVSVPPITYNWQSVPSISGKNGISFLSTIQSVYLNNGDPVNNALESYIDFIDDSKVAVLVEQEIDDLTKVTVKYIVPAGTYEYIKLVYKAGSAPTSITDGTAVDILQAAKQVSISGIADGNTYFFKIFTDITESEPYEFTTVRPIGAELFKIDLSTDGHDIMRYDPNKIINVEYSYYGELRPWFNAAQGALTDAEHPSQPTYTISNGELTTTGGTQTLAWAYDVTANQRIIPANCTLWFEFDACFLNGEGYLDWRMYDNQSNEVIYWCWDTKYNFGSGIWYNCQLKASVVNGIINRIEYYIDHTMVDAETNNNIHMLCIDETNPVPLYYITFTTTKSTKLKNMKIYWE